MFITTPLRRPTRAGICITGSKRPLRRRSSTIRNDSASWDFLFAGEKWKIVPSPTKQEAPDVDVAARRARSIGAGVCSAAWRSRRHAGTGVPRRGHPRRRRLGRVDPEVVRHRRRAARCVERARQPRYGDREDRALAADQPERPGAPCALPQRRRRADARGAAAHRRRGLPRRGEVAARPPPRRALREAAREGRRRRARRVLHLRRRHPQRHLRPRHHPGPRRRPDPRQVPLPLHRLRRRLHRKLAVVVGAPSPRADWRRAEGAERRAEVDARSGAAAAAAPPRLQQLPQPEARLSLRRHVDDGRALHPQRAAEPPRPRAGAGRAARPAALVREPASDLSGHDQTVDPRPHHRAGAGGRLRLHRPGAARTPGTRIDDRGDQYELVVRRALHPSADGGRLRHQLRLGGARQKTHHAPGCDPVRALGWGGHGPAAVHHLLRPLLARLVRRAAAVGHAQRRLGLRVEAGHGRIRGARRPRHRGRAARAPGAESLSRSSAGRPERQLLPADHAAPRAVAAGRALRLLLGPAYPHRLLRSGQHLRRPLQPLQRGQRPRVVGPRRAVLLMVAILGGGASFIAVFGPVLLYQAPMFFGAVGAGTGGGAALLGYSARTPAQGKKREKGDKSGAVTSALLNFAAPIFAVVLLAAISLGTSELLRLIDFKHTNTPAAERAEARRKVDAQFLATVSKEETHRTYHLKSEIKDVPLQSMAAQRAWFHLSGIQGTDRTELAFIYGLAAGAVFLSLFIGVNRFSMHGLYRNRLIRAYLGASRYNRDPDRFTGFDENDNLQMYELRPQLLWPNSFTDACDFVDQVSKHAGDVERRIWDALGDKIQNRIKEVKDKQYPGTLISAVTQRVNVLMQTIDLATGKPDGNPVKLLDANRKLLEKTFRTLKPLGAARPLHVVNTALNLVSGDNLAWQQRMAESFTVSPLHCGSLYLGYRDAREYGGPDGISLGTAVTISGAAASPNMGYHSSVPLAFILTLLNVRLGAWLGNPGAAGEGSYKKGSPNGNLVPLGYELTGNTNDRCPWVYLSDGGHFENLALYEMVLRRCRYIVVSDGGCDPTFTYEDLGNAIRKIRIDLGVPIEIDSREMFPRPKPGEPLRSGSYIATATIKYSAVDEGGRDGLLIYLKPSVYKEGTLPRDVYNYAQQSPDFPHESPGDHFFSESQFESDRALGRHVFDVICRNGKPQPSTGDLPAFAKAMLPIKKQDDVVGSMEVTTTNGEISVAHGVADGVQIRIRQTNA